MFGPEIIKFKARFTNQIKHKVLDWSADSSNIENPLDREEVVDWNEADTISSECKDLQDIHIPILDIDFPVFVYPSSTPGHSHLYIQKHLTWENYKKLLKVMADVGLIEEGYYNASIERKGTYVRLPWIQKQSDNVVDLFDK